MAKSRFQPDRDALPKDAPDEYSPDEKFGGLKANDTLEAEISPSNVNIHGVVPLCRHLTYREKRSVYHGVCVLTSPWLRYCTHKILGERMTELGI